MTQADKPLPIDFDVRDVPQSAAPNAPLLVPERENAPLLVAPSDCERALRNSGTTNAQLVTANGKDRQTLRGLQACRLDPMDDFDLLHDERTRIVPTFGKMMGAKLKLEF